MHSNFIISFFLLWTQFNAQDCTYTSPDGLTFYDLSALTLSSSQGDYIGYDNTTSYTLNVCAPSNAGGECSANKSSICKWANKTVTTISSYVATPKPEWSLYDWSIPADGVILTSNNGPKCYDSLSNQTYNTRSHLLLRCNPNANANKSRLLTFSTDEGGCVYHFRLESPYACPVNLSTIVSGKTVNWTAGSGTWTYWKINASTSFYELSFAVKQSSGNGTVKLYARRGSLPTSISFDASTSDHVLTLRNTTDKALQAGVYYFAAQVVSGGVNGTLQANMYLCPKNCSGHGTCNSGICSCELGYQSDRDDCSAPVYNLTLGQPTTGVANSGNPLTYYRVSLKNNSFLYQLSIDLKRLDGTAKSTVLMMALNEWPSLAKENTLSDRSNGTTSWRLDVFQPAAQIWIVGVVANGETNFTFQLTASLFDCQNGCSQHGKCNTQNHVCTCDEDYTIMDDCSIHTQTLQPTQLASDFANYSQFLYFRTSIPEELSYHVSNFTFLLTQKKTTNNLTLYLAPSRLPTSTSFFSRDVAITTTNSQTTLRVPLKTLLVEGSSTWFIAVYNPNTTDASVSVMIQYEGICSATCVYPRGTCSPLYPGMCNCNNGWQGEGCEEGIPTDVPRQTTEYGMLVFLMLILVAIPVTLVVRWMCRSPEHRPSCCSAPNVYEPLPTVTTAKPLHLQEGSVSPTGSINRDLRKSYHYAYVPESAPENENELL